MRVRVIRQFLDGKHVVHEGDEFEVDDRRAEQLKRNNLVVPVDEAGKTEGGQQQAAGTGGEGAQQQAAGTGGEGGAETGAARPITSSSIGGLTGAAKPASSSRPAPQPSTQVLTEQAEEDG